MRLAAILKMIDLEDTDEVGSTLYNLSKDPSVIQDEWLSRAVYVGAVNHKESFTKALHASESARIAKGYIDLRRRLIIRLKTLISQTGKM